MRDFLEGFVGDEWEAYLNFHIIINNSLNYINTSFESEIQAIAEDYANILGIELESWEYEDGVICLNGNLKHKVNYTIGTFIKYE